MKFEDIDTIISIRISKFNSEAIDIIFLPNINEIIDKLKIFTKK